MNQADTYHLTGRTEMPMFQSIRQIPRSQPDEDPCYIIDTDRTMFNTTESCTHELYAFGLQDWAANEIIWSM